MDDIESAQSEPESRVNQVKSCLELAQVSLSLRMLGPAKGRGPQSCVVGSLREKGWRI